MKKSNRSLVAGIALVAFGTGGIIHTSNVSESKETITKCANVIVSVGDDIQFHNVLGEHPSYSGNGSWHKENDSEALYYSLYEDSIIFGTAESAKNCSPY